MRYVQATVSVANGASLTNTAIPSPDDNTGRTLHAIWVPPQSAAGVVITVRRAGFPLAVFDSLRCAIGNFPLVIEEYFDNTLQFTVDVANTSGGAVSGMPVQIAYYTGRPQLTTNLAG